MNNFTTSGTIPMEGWTGTTGTGWTGTWTGTIEIGDTNKKDRLTNQKDQLDVIASLFGYSPDVIASLLGSPKYVNYSYNKGLLGHLPDCTSDSAHCPKIVDYSYNKGTTKIVWDNGEITTCHTDSETADQYTGFMIALAKYFMGNKNQATNLADYWINKVPAKKKKEEEKIAKQIAEEKRLETKRRERRARNRIRRAAIRRAEEYQAKILAKEKYGVPTDFNE